MLQRLAARARGVAELHDFRFRRKDGRFVWGSLATSPTTLADGAKGALAMIRDVTEQRAMEAELRESKERLELALAVGQMGTWEWSLDRNVTRASHQLREILGLPADAPLATNDQFLRAVHPEDIAELEARMNVYVASGSTERFVNNFRIVRPDGTVRWSATFAERSATPQLAEELRTIKIAAERGADLTRQLLAFARKQVIELVSIDLNQILTNLERVLQRLVGEDVTLTQDLAEDLWRLRGGVSQVEQVIMNLVVNARDAMPDGGTIGIITRNVSVGPAPAAEHLGVPLGEYVMIGVSDAGVGIDPAVLPHIFEPFYTTKRTGTGLGLASAYGIVKQLGGHIRVDSRPNVGTTFSVFLPREQTEAAVEPAAKRSAVGHRTGATILFVEDDELVRGVVPAHWPAPAIACSSPVTAIKRSTSPVPMPAGSTS
jgi:signal transduction histidine kinase